MATFLESMHSFYMPAQHGIHPGNMPDDGFFPYLATGDMWDSILEIPVLEPPQSPVIPEAAIPFSKLNQSDSHSECVVFFEHDWRFAHLYAEPENYLPTLAKHPCIATPDCSLYRDSPLVIQLANIYLNRLMGQYFQTKGLNVIPTVRWGDERTYTDVLFGFPPAFVGLPEESIYWLGSYGLCRHRENRLHLKAGLTAMVEALHPRCILVYGSMPMSVFGEFIGETSFIQFPDWTTYKKRDANG